jgi:phosphopantothenoylcysteine decarboxylase/phosphopantothenate--cysteine ligase
MSNALPLPAADARMCRIVLGVTGGVAAYKAAELARLFVKANVDVHVVMTESATRFVGATTFQALTANPVHVDLWDTRIANQMPHIELSRHADAIVVAPTTANFLAKLAHGTADDLLSTLCLARNASICPLFVAPAMNREMWEAAATQRNIAQIVADGTTILGPDAGEQACGEVGTGRMLEPEAIFEAVMAALGPKPLQGKRAMVTAGPTFEPIDPVRGITNSSSGKMGYAIAEALAAAGADVILISGPTALPPPPAAKLTKITTSSQMFDAVMAKIGEVDLFFAVAAVADYAPRARSEQKIKKSDVALTLELEPTRDILASVAATDKPPFCVGFAAESENIVEYARKKRERKGIPLIVANSANSAIGAEDNEVTLIDRNGDHFLPKAPKHIIAKQIVAHAAELYLRSAGRASLSSISSTPATKHA